MTEAGTMLRVGARSVLLGVLGLLVACSSTGTIQGTITVDGSSDASALVSIPGQSFQAGAGGTFTFNAVPAGQVTVIATRDGFTPATQTVAVVAGKSVSVSLALSKAPVAPSIVSLTATPAAVPPGGTVALAALATSADGYPLTYSWTVPMGWTASGSTNESTLLLTAPSKFSASAQVVLTVDEGHGKNSSASVVVTTTEDMAPVASITATPTNPQVGQPVILNSWASAANGQKVTYSWTLTALPVGSVARLDSDTEAGATFTPDLAGNYVARLVVTDESGLSSQPASVTVSVTNQRPTATITISPTNPQIGVPVHLIAQANAAANAMPLTFNWSLTAVPTGSTAMLAGAMTSTATYTPDVAGTYVAQLLVTDANGIVSTPVIANVSVGLVSPVAAISGSQPLVDAVNQAVVLDGTKSSNASGNPLSYTWSVTSWPMSSHCGGSSCLVAVGSDAQAKFTPDVAGNYGVLLTVKDVVTSLVATATTAVQVNGLQQLSVVSGNGQTATVRQLLGQPLVVQLLAADGQTPIPNVGLTWVPANATLKQSSSTTDANGKATAVVQAGRVADSGSVKVFVTSMPTINQSLTFTAQPDQPASFAVSASVGNADVGATVTVKVVDQFGNPTVANSAANTASLQLALSSSTNKAAFGAATTGSISVNGANPSQATVTLVNGVFSGTITDTAAETVQISATRAGTAVLPISAWTTQLYDGAETGLGKWNVSNGSGASAPWSTGTMQVQSGSNAFATNFSTAQELTTQESDLITTAALPVPASGGVTLLSFQSNVQVAPAFDAMNNCAAQTYFRVRMTSSANGGGSYTAVTPLGGYEIQDPCNAGPSFGPTSGSWIAETVDVTDYISGTPYVSFQASNVPDANVAMPAQPSSWAIDEVYVRSLSAPSFSGATANAIIQPGAPTNVQFPTPQNQQVLYNTCKTGQSPFSVTLMVLDKNGNIANAAPALEVDWTGASASLAPTLPISGATVLAVLPSGVQLQLKQGQVTFQLPDMAQDTLTFSVSTLSSGLTAGAPISLTSPVYYCHSAGIGSWSDTTPQNNFNSTEALYACQNYYGQGNCATNSYYAYPTTGTCGSHYGWVFNGLTMSTSSGCGSNTHMNAGAVVSENEYNPGTCSCSSTNGGTTNVSWTQYYSWN